MCLKPDLVQGETRFDMSLGSLQQCWEKIHVEQNLRRRQHKLQVLLAVEIAEYCTPPRYFVAPHECKRGDKKMEDLFKKINVCSSWTALCTSVLIRSFVGGRACYVLLRSFVFNRASILCFLIVLICPGKPCFAGQESIEICNFARLPCLLASWHFDSTSSRTTWKKNYPHKSAKTV